MIDLGINVQGIATWSPGAAPSSAPRALSSPPAAGAAPASSSRTAARARRRGSLLMQIVTDVATAATQQAGVSLSNIHIIVGSAFGELGTTMELLAELVDGGVLSPTRFHNSVHNSAAGTMSIAHGNRASATSLAAGNDTVAIGLLEAATALGTRCHEVLLILADEALPDVIAPGQAAAPVGAALVLTHPSHSQQPALARLHDLRRVSHLPPRALRDVEMSSPCSAVLPLLAAIRQGHPGPVSLAPPGVRGWSVEVSLVNRS